MAVELPRIGRLEPQAPQSVGRFEANLPNIAEATAPIGRAVSESVDKIADANTAFTKKQQSVWDVKTSDLANQFELRRKEALAKINVKDGDTLSEYKKYDEDADNDYNEVLKQYGTMDPMFQELLKNKISTAYGKQESFRNIQQFEQDYKYQNNVTKSAIALDQDNFLNAGLRLDIKDPKSFTLLDGFRSRIEQAHISQGERSGTLVRDDKGNPMVLEGGPAQPLPFPAAAGRCPRPIRNPRLRRGNLPHRGRLGALGV